MDLDIDAPEWGWELPKDYHTGAGGLHPRGWSRDWETWIKEQEGAGKPITVESIKCHLETEMRPKYAQILNVEGARQATTRYPGTPAGHRRSWLKSTPMAVGLAIFAAASSANASQNHEVEQLFFHFDLFRKHVNSNDYTSAELESLIVANLLGNIFNQSEPMQVWTHLSLMDVFDDSPRPVEPPKEEPWWKFW